MQRLVLAVLIVAFAAFALVAVAGAARRVWGAKGGGGEPMRQGGDVMQRVSFFLLIALILYVSVLGGA